MIIVGIIVNIFLYLNNKDKPSIIENKIQQNEEKPFNKLNYYYNLRGDLLSRPIAFMINNIPDALPQSGIYGADYIYELLVEGGYTRIMAIYTKNIDVNKIGPIRSARHYFYDISMEYDAIYAHFGGSNRAYEDIKTLGIPNLNGMYLDGQMYWRDKNRKAPHNAYTSIEKTLEYAKKYKYNKLVFSNNFKFNTDDKFITGKSAQKVNIPYSKAHSISYEYDNEIKLYKRSMNGKPHMDALIDTQLTAKNIIIQFAKNNSVDDEDRQEIYLVGEGKGYYITNGKCMDITWEKTLRSVKTVFRNSAGEEIVLNNGQTWIQVIPINSVVTIE